MPPNSLRRSCNWHAPSRYTIHPDARVCFVERGNAFYAEISSERYGYGIYALPIMCWKMYIVTSPPMASALNRVPKNLSFRPIQVGLVERVGSLPQQTDKINKTNLMDEEGQGIMGAIHDVMYSMLPSGPPLEKLTQAVLDHVAENLQQLPHDKMEVGLYDLCKVIMGRSTVSALYGKGTPLDHPSFIPDYWDFDASSSFCCLMPIFFLLKNYLTDISLIARFLILDLS